MWPRTAKSNVAGESRERAGADEVSMAHDRDIVSSLGPVGNAFLGAFSGLRDIQRAAIPPILSGQNVLVASATASGKTEAILAPLVARVLANPPQRVERIRILLLAPTRALVNDLTARIHDPLGRLGVTCGRQTSDRSDKYKNPFVLVTTPESLDSMLVRDARLEAGRVVDHLLAGVSSVFVDEAHLFDGTARGDQLAWLLARLRRLWQLPIGRESRDVSHTLQLCAGTATVGDPLGLARRLLGPEGIVVQVDGVREIEVFESSHPPEWVPLEAAETVAALRDRLGSAPTTGFSESAAQRIWEAMRSESATVRKILVFVPTRSLCDSFASELFEALRRYREVDVVAHHGSLSRERREQAERRFASSRDVVMVATTTLEVGIDIGDVDMVVLVGSPPDTRSLLQRIGRAGRRVGRTRVLALPRTEMERAALASLLLSARDGVLERSGYGRRWSVFVQQTASFVAQARPRSRRVSDLRDLADAVWPEEPAATALAIVENLVDAGLLVAHRDRVALGSTWADVFDEGGRGMHANLDSSAVGIPVIDASTGAIVARVAERPPADQDLSLAGQRWKVQDTANGEILLTPKVGAGGARGSFRYAARSAPTGQAFSEHVRRGLGFDECDAPLIESPSGIIWLHFAGSGYQIVLRALLPNLRPVAGLAGLAVEALRVEESQLLELATEGGRLRHAVESHFADLERVVSAGPFQRHLPGPCRREVVAELVDIPALRRWLSTRRVWHLTRDDPRWALVEEALLTDADR